MSNSPSTTKTLAKADDPRIAVLVAQYQAEWDQGQRPDQVAYLARFPELAADLAPCLEVIDFVGRLMPALDDTAPTALQANAVLGDIRIVRPLARGGMGIVYEAEQISLKRKVALKVLPSVAALDERSLQRFQHESQAAAALKHPHIVPVYSVGQQDGIHFYAMQLIAGESLGGLVRRLRDHRAQLDNENRSTQKIESDPTASQAPSFRTIQETTTPTSMPEGDVLLCGAAYGSRAYFGIVARLFVAAAEALQHAHEVGVIHRDVKPANLLLDEEGKLWVADFGLARLPGSDLTGSADVMGTLRYMAPEQASGKSMAIDPRSDVYSLGASLYEVLTLSPAFEADHQEALLRKVLTEEPVAPRRRSPRIPRDLETIVLKAMSKFPASRYSSAREMAADLERFLQDKPIHARRISIIEQSWRWCRQNRLVASLGGTILILLVAIAAIQFQKNRQLNMANESLSSSNDKLTQTNSKLQKALNDVETANQNVKDRLLQSYLDQLRLGRTNVQPSSQESAMEILELAAQLRPTPELRNEAMSYLARRSFVPASNGEDAKDKSAFPGRFGLTGLVQRPSKIVISQKGGVDKVTDKQLGSISIDVMKEELASCQNTQFSSDGVFLFVVLSKKQTRPRQFEAARSEVWNWRENRKLADLPAPGSRNAYCWGENGKLCILRDEKILIFDPRTLETADVRIDSEGLKSSSLTAMRISPDASFAAIVHRNGVEFHDLHKDSSPSIPSLSLSETTANVMDINKKWMAICAAGNIVYVCQQGRIVRQIALDTRPLRLALSPVNDLLLVFDGGSTRIFNLSNGQVIGQFEMGGMDAQFSLDGQAIGWNGFVQLELSADKGVWECEFREAPAEVMGSFSFSFDSRKAVLLAEKCADVWDLVNRKKLCELPGELSAVGFLPDNRSLIGLSKTTNQWLRYELPTNLTDAPKMTECAGTLLPAPNRKFLQATTYADHVRLLFATNEQCPEIIEVNSDGLFASKTIEHRGANQVAMDVVNGSWVVTGDSTSPNSPVRVWEYSSSKLLHAIPNVRTFPIQPIQDGRTVVLFAQGAAAPAERNAVFWETDRGAISNEFTLPKGARPQIGFAFSPKYREGIVHDGAALRLVDLLNSSTLAVWPDERMFIAMRYSRSGDYLGLLTQTGCVIWDLRRVRTWLRARNLDWNSTPIASSP